MIYPGIRNKHMCFEMNAEICSIHFNSDYLGALGSIGWGELKLILDKEGVRMKTEFMWLKEESTDPIL